jgi:flagellar hook-basal body complex protein FliE
MSTPVSALAALETFNPIDRPSLALLPAGVADGQGLGLSFDKLMGAEVSRVNANLEVAETAMRDYASGKPVELHELMLNLERARISVQVFMQIRNKLVESYQDLMRTQM